MHRDWTASRWRARWRSKSSSCQHHVITWRGLIPADHEYLDSVAWPCHDCEVAPVWHHDVTIARTCQFSVVCLAVFPFEFRPRTFTIGFYGKNSIISELMILECSFPLNCPRSSLFEHTFRQWLWGNIADHAYSKTLRCRGMHRLVDMLELRCVEASALCWISLAGMSQISAHQKKESFMILLASKASERNDCLTDTPTDSHRQTCRQTEKDTQITRHKCTSKQENERKLRRRQCWSKWLFDFPTLEVN